MKFQGELQGALRKYFQNMESGLVFFRYHFSRGSRTHLHREREVASGVSIFTRELGKTFSEFLCPLGGFWWCLSSLMGSAKRLPSSYVH